MDAHFEHFDLALFLATVVDEADWPTRLTQSPGATADALANAGVPAGGSGPANAICGPHAALRILHSTVPRVDHCVVSVNRREHKLAQATLLPYPSMPCLALQPVSPVFVPVPPRNTFARPLWQASGGVLGACLSSSKPTADAKSTADAERPWFSFV